MKMLVYYVLISLLLFSKFHVVCGELFICTAHFQDSKRTAVDLVKHMDKYIKQEELKIQLLKRISSSMKGQFREEFHGAPPTPPNPVTMFQFAKTMTAAIYSIKQISDNTRDNAQLTQMISEFANGLPTEDDVDGVANSFIRLQNTYNLTAAELASGNVLGMKVTPLSAFDCYDIGDVIYEQQYYRIALQWFNTALRQLKETDVTIYDKHDINEFVHMLNNKIHDAKGQQRKLQLQTKLQLLSTRTKSVDTAKIEKNNMVASRTLSYYGVESGRNLEGSRNYEFTCAQRDIRVGGFCRYSTIEDLAFFKRPIKIEIISKSPRIVIVHDIIDQQLIDRLQSFSDRLKRSTIYQPHAETKETSRPVYSGRTSSTYSYIDDVEDHVVMKFYSLLERLTGLRTNIKQSDHIQVVNYGIGGEFIPHNDWVPELGSHFATGTNRMVTVLLYLSDVEVGGSTVFPNLNIAISPVKGSALFFTNLDSEGKGDTRVLHAGCPVLFGSKWVANKWIHERDQDMTFWQTVPSLWFY